MNPGFLSSALFWTDSPESVFLALRRHSSNKVARAPEDRINTQCCKQSLPFASKKSPDSSRKTSNTTHALPDRPPAPPKDQSRSKAVEFFLKYKVARAPEDRFATQTLLLPSHNQASFGIDSSVPNKLSNTTQSTLLTSPRHAQLLKNSRD